MEQVCVWFYDPARDSEGMFNKMVAYADPPYCHCEFQFADSTACSIYVGSKVIMKSRNFDPVHYTPVKFLIAREQADNAFRHCRHKQAQGGEK